MKRSSLCAGLAAAVLAGCASAPRSPQTAMPGLTSPAPAESVAPQPAAAAADREERAGDLVVQAQVDAQDVHPGSEVVCKEMLQHASNVITRRCMTRDTWKRYEAAEAQRAQAILRAWQGSPYAGF